MAGPNLSVKKSIGGAGRYLGLGHNGELIHEGKDGRRGVISPVNLTSGEIASPTAAILADTTATYVGPNGERLYSDGNHLVIFGPYTDAVVLDDFSGSSAALLGRVTPMGQVWSTSGAGAATATAGNGQFASGSNVYGILPYGAQIPVLGGTFSFSGSGTRSTTVFALIANASATLFLDNIVHLQFFPSGWSLEKRIAGGSLDLITSGVLNLNTGGAIYSIGMSIAADGAITVLLPDGSSVTTSADAAIAALTLDQAVYQIVNPGAGVFTGYWNAAYISDSILIGKNRSPIAGTASIVDVNDLKGAVLTQRQTWRGRFSGTGWHRLISPASWLTTCVAGTLSVSMNDSGGASQVFSMHTSGFWDATPTLTKLFEAFYVVRIITAVRVSRDSTSFLLALDINVNQAEVGIRDFVVEWRGVGELVTPPSSGASAYVTETVTVTF